MWVFECMVPGCRFVDDSFIASQKHLMDAHGITEQDLVSMTRTSEVPGHRWALPSGKHTLRVRLVKAPSVRLAD